MMNDNVELLELVYEYLKKIKHSDTFENIWNAIAVNDISVQGHSKEDVIAELYTDLVLDNRFVLTSEGMWGLRELLKYDEIKKQYDYTDQFETTEEFEDIDLDEEQDEDDLSDQLDFDYDLDEDIDDNDDDEDLTEIDLDDDLAETEFSVDDDEQTVAAKLGITEEIDWQALEKEMEENN